MVPPAATESDSDEDFDAVTLDLLDTPWPKGARAKNPTGSTDKGQAAANDGGSSLSSIGEDSHEELDLEADEEDGA